MKKRPWKNHHWLRIWVQGMLEEGIGGVLCRQFNGEVEGYIFSEG